MAIEDLPHIGRPPESEAEWFAALIGMARYLRSPQGCPWDREQSAAQFARYSHGEGAELVDAFEQGDAAHIAEEFGDTLFTLLASAAAAEEEGLFTLEYALRLAHEKMVRRHDHVFGAEKAATAEEAIELWERAKAAEKKRS
jgi:tetrapyrrole methylase family protein/MazG family protein